MIALEYLQTRDVSFALIEASYLLCLFTFVSLVAESGRVTQVQIERAKIYTFAARGRRKAFFNVLDVY